MSVRTSTFAGMDPARDHGRLGAPGSARTRSFPAAPARPLMRTERRRREVAGEPAVRTDFARRLAQALPERPLVLRHLALQITGPGAARGCNSPTRGRTTRGPLPDWHAAGGWTVVDHADPAAGRRQRFRRNSCRPSPENLWTWSDYRRTPAARRSRATGPLRSARTIGPS